MKSLMTVWAEDEEIKERGGGLGMVEILADDDDVKSGR